MANSINVQRFRATVSADGETFDLITDGSGDAVGDINKTFEVVTSSTWGPGGAGNNVEVEADDLSLIVELTGTRTVTFHRPATTPGQTCQVDFELWEYTGAAGGANEFKVLGRPQPTYTSSGNHDTTVTAATDIDDVAIFPRGYMNDDTINGGEGLHGIWLMTSTTNARLITGNSPSGGPNMEAGATVVEFTGSAWSVGHADSGTTYVTADSGTLTLKTDADGVSGTNFDVSAWGTAFIIGMKDQDTNEDGNAAMACLFEPAAATTQVDWTFDNNNQASNRLFCHVVKHADLDVTRITSTNTSLGDQNIDVTSAGITDLSAAGLLVYSEAPATGPAAYPRNWTSVRYTTTTNVQRYRARGGSGFSITIEVIDLVGLQEDTGTSANAQVANGTGTAHNATVAVAPSGGNAAGTGTAPNPAAALAPTSSTATGSGTGQNTQPDIGATPQAAAATGQAGQPSAAITAPAATATGTGTGHNAEARPGAAAQPATGTGTADNPSTAITIPASTATGSGTANNATPALGAAAAHAPATGTAHNPTIAATSQPATATGTGAGADPDTAITANPATATGTGTAHDATVDTSAGINALAEVATGTGTALAAAIGITALPPTATGTGTANNPTVDTAENVNAPAGTATGTGTANAARAAISTTPAAASGTGTAASAPPHITALALAAIASGAAHNPAVALQVIAIVAAGTGTANGVIIAQPRLAGVRNTARLGPRRHAATLGNRHTARPGAARHTAQPVT